MNVFDELDIILTRLGNCPLNLVHAELEMFRNTLRSDVHSVTVLEDIIRSDPGLGSRASTLVKGDINSSNWADLGFANSASLRAALGYEMCANLLDDPNCGKEARNVGEYYGAQRGSHRQTEAESVSVFSDIFLRPLVSYLRGGMESRHRMLTLLSRYKQRGEWFPDEDLLEEASVPGRDLEKRVKRDFLRYLFDHGIDFSVESEIPSGGTRVDVLPVLPDAGFFPIEVKIFNGKDRAKQYISDGIAQAGDYANKFNSTEAGYLIYNLAENTTLNLPGSRVGPNVISVQWRAVTIYSISVDLRRTIPASEAGSLKTVDIALPESETQSA